MKRLFLLTTLAALITCASFGCGQRAEVPADAHELGQVIVCQHQDWQVHSATPMFCYVVAQRHAVVQPSTYDGQWTVQPPLAGGTVEQIRQTPFEKKEWQGIVLIRCLTSVEQVPEGWYGAAALVRGTYLFYGDQQMLLQLNREREEE